MAAQDLVVHSSTDYKKFKFIPGNRKVSPLHLRALRESIGKRNLLKYQPGIVNSEWGIVDGQHRFTIAQEKGLPFYFLRGNDIEFSDIILLNNVNRAWKLEDYLETYIDQGLENYIELKKFSEKHNLSLSNSIAILSNVGTGKLDLNAPLTEYKLGKFEIFDKAEATEFVQNLRDISVYAEENTAKDRDFIGAIYRMIYRFEIDPVEFIKRLKIYPYPLFRRLTIKEYLLQLESVFNNNRSKIVRFL